MQASEKTVDDAPDALPASLKLAVAEDDLIDNETTWDTLGLDLRLLKAITRLGYKHPTLVQSKGIPLALKGKDILAKARTGSGKTAAYMLPILHRILESKEKEATQSFVRALVLVPTRELCEQVKAVISVLIRYCVKQITCTHLVGVGKTGMQPEKVALREQPDVVVSTPSRLVEHLKANNLSIKTLQFLVIDEADLILSYGYEDDIRAIAEHLPRVCQAFLMSATLNPQVESLKQLVLHTPAVLKLSEAVQQQQTLKEYSISCKENDKFLISYVLIRLKLLPGKTLFFVNSIDRGYRFRIFLEKFSLKAAVLNSELPHKSRQHILKEFNQGVFDYLIAVDEAPSAAKKRAGERQEEEEEEEEGNNIDGGDEENERKTSKRKAAQKKDNEFGVARGVDFKGVKAVINFDFPIHASAYTHRIGRTARGGDVGMALSFVTPDDEAMLDEVKSRQKAEGKTEVAPYNFKMSLVDGFRYRVEDVLRSVTSLAVKEARLNEIRAEILNSEKLKTHFEDHPRDLQLLQHDRPLTNERAAEHLKHIPSYIMPAPKPLTGKRGPADRTSDKSKGKKARSDEKDPLRSFSYEKSKTSRRAPAAAAAAKDENEIRLDDQEQQGGEEDQEMKEREEGGEVEEDDEEDLDSVRQGYGLAYGKKVVKERKLKYLRGAKGKKAADRMRKQLEKGEY